MNKADSEFDEIIDRDQFATLKFDRAMLKKLFGSEHLWPSWVADMDFRAAPAIIDALEERLQHGVFGYENSSDEIARAASDWYQSRYHWHFPASAITFTPRTLNSITVLIELFSGQGDGVIIQPPVFYDFKLIVKATDRRLIKNALTLQDGRYQMDFDDLEKRPR